eukprot:CAMPEP_0185033476 /NCGR_PEP_ID=MMETSP1103-20130426/22452_1 /TAXON_ID=36769 /ORGANISM="Paraphysomonas bandaiensis, Strain Caron Lab Isolate" /LENGTH=499 /DNA_ID=CAMNT_0027569757 /DNA_START=102 /DNA_END=1598 /DNA_ORIENTATION=-
MTHEDNEQQIVPITYDGKLLLIGVGSIGLGVLPLLLRHINFTQDKAISIITGEDRTHVAEEVHKLYGVPFLVQKLTPDNYECILERYQLVKGDFIVNLSVDVSSVDVIKWCQKRGVLYIDTVVEPWPGTYDNPELSMAQRTNYALREEALAYLRTRPKDSSTAIITHGANPGMVSHFVKQALLNIAAEHFGEGSTPIPTSREEWGRLAMSLGVQAIHISERDSQWTETTARCGLDGVNRFVNTWSVDGFLSEGCQPAELGWGTHEKSLPVDGREHATGCGAAIFLTRPGAGTRVRSWTPQGGAHAGYLITHNEAISIADYFTVRSGSEETDVRWRPTVMYAYRPCDSAVLALEELAAQNWNKDFFTEKVVVVEEIQGGVDELGVLIMGSKSSSDDGVGVVVEPYAYWYGSQLECNAARKLAKYNSATSLQVTSAVLAGVLWAIRNPNRGVLEPEYLPYDEILDTMSPYISPVVGVFTDWTPLNGKGVLFPEDMDQSDPW